MSQYDFGTINPSTTSGTALAALLGSWRDALNSGHSGTSRPSYAEEGTVWIDTTANPWILNVYDGVSADIPLGTLNTSTGVFTVDGIGSLVQAYDADTAKTDVAQTFTASQRGTITTDNDGNFDQSVTNNFFCTPSGAVALTFTNHTAGQSGLILFVNGSNYAVTAAATTYIAAADLTKLSATGTYICSYISDGTNTYVVVSAALTSAGA